ncbi:glutathione S-transferase [Exidia glandulosa HHB12029]|uniref:glutathione transferase n=1 Tax=Exidia glandulosa HHB12029 TaxID=1314781 RepID=A0A165II92_EXIGL|nr:glutathione S-transferase [Exidia glandulosa HHB12029]
MPPKPVKLYGSPMSTCTRRVAMVFRELDVPYELVPIDFSKREHKAIAHMARQPFGQVPVIDDNGFLLYESRAIGRYLAAKHTPNTLVPPQSDLKAWARFEQAASIETANFDPYASGLAYERVFGPAKGESTDEKRVQTLLQTLDAKLDAYETILGNSTYLAGEEFTLADLFHLPYGAFVTERVGFDVLTDPKRPNVVRWWKAISSRPAWLAVKDGA